MKILTYKEKWLSARTSSKILVFWKESILYSTATIDTLLGLLSKRGETKKSSRHLTRICSLTRSGTPRSNSDKSRAKNIIRGPFSEGGGRGHFQTVLILILSSKRVRVSLICTWHIWEGPKKQALHQRVGLTYMKYEWILNNWLNFSLELSFCRKEYWT